MLLLGGKELQQVGIVPRSLLAKAWQLSAERYTHRGERNGEVGGWAANPLTPIPGNAF